MTNYADGTFIWMAKRRNNANSPTKASQTGAKAIPGNRWKAMREIREVSQRTALGVPLFFWSARVAHKEAGVVTDRSPHYEHDKNDAYMLAMQLKGWEKLDCRKSHSTVFLTPWKGELGNAILFCVDGVDCWAHSRIQVVRCSMYNARVTIRHRDYCRTLGQ
uniref:C-type lectin domain-containing protein n=1 Tax=Steinernema glaseri TaxID=37863 RepID=A0A1I7ZEI6_9BILA